VPTLRRSPSGTSRSLCIGTSVGFATSDCLSEVRTIGIIFFGRSTCVLSAQALDDYDGKAKGIPKISIPAAASFEDMAAATFPQRECSNVRRAAYDSRRKTPNGSGADLLKEEPQR
jgi:hypothetical protein